MSLSWHKPVPSPKGAVLPWPPPSPHSPLLCLCPANKTSSMTWLEVNHSQVLFGRITFQTNQPADATHLRTQGKQQGADKRVGLVFSAQVKSYISSRQPLDSPFGVKSFSHRKLDKRVSKECNKRLQKNAEVTKLGFQVVFSFPQRNSGLVSTQKAHVHLVQHIVSYTIYV